MKNPFTDTSPISVAKPHTIKKFELISHYVDEWARKMKQAAHQNLTQT